MGRALLLVPLLVSGLWAQGERKDLKDLLAEALNNNPEIVAAQKRYEASRQRPTQASSLPDPMFSPGYQSIRYPWPGAGLGSAPMANVGVMVSQEIPFPGKRKLAGDMAEKESGAFLNDYQEVQLRVVSRLKQAYYRRAYAWRPVHDWMKTGRFYNFATGRAAITFMLMGSPGSTISILVLLLKMTVV